MKRLGWVVVVAAVAVSLALLGGCGGSVGQVPPDEVPSAAVFVGRQVCAGCHAGANGAYGSYSGVPYVPGSSDPSQVYANFKGSAHGQNMASKGPGNRDAINGAGGSCQPCHTTGYGETSGFKSVAETPHLVGIGCEECHTRGSSHAGGPSSRNIRKWPVASESCWDCHTPSYKWLQNGNKEVDDTTLANMAPSAVHPHNRNLPVLLGYLGYKRDQIQGPHQWVENTCVTCHLSEESSSHHGRTALQADFDACVACHGSEAAAEALLEHFEEEVNDLLIEIVGEDPSDPGHPDPDFGGGLMAAFIAKHGINYTANDNPNDPNVQALKGAQWNVVTVEGGPAVHNPPYVMQLLTDAKNMLK